MYRRIERETVARWGRGPLSSSAPVLSKDKLFGPTKREARILLFVFWWCRIQAERPIPTDKDKAALELEVMRLSSLLQEKEDFIALAREKGLESIYAMNWDGKGREGVEIPP